jgi:hypothetical protein
MNLSERRAFPRVQREVERRRPIMKMTPSGESVGTLGLDTIFIGYKVATHPGMVPGHVSPPTIKLSLGLMEGTKSIPPEGIVSTVKVRVSTT